MDRYIKTVFSFDDTIINIGTVGAVVSVGIENGKPYIITETSELLENKENLKSTISLHQEFVNLTKEEIKQKMKEGYEFIGRSKKISNELIEYHGKFINKEV